MKSAKRTRPTDNGPRGRWLRWCLYWGTVAAIWCFVLLGGLGIYYTSLLPRNVVEGLDKRPPNIIILAADGTVMAERGLRRGHIRIQHLPPYLVNAVLATEDRRFYGHFGVDPLGLARATVANLRAGTVVEGGSTISQQLAKNLFLSSERTLARKAQEVILAIWLETKFTKRELLELYLNRVYFGGGAYGVEAASRRYFAKSARHVTLSEAALLAGLLKAPSRYAPTRSIRRSEARAAEVIGNMVEAGLLKPSLALDALGSPARVRDPHRISGHEYAVDWIIERLPKLIGNQTGDLVIETTIDAKLQPDAQQIVDRVMARHGVLGKSGEAALVLLGPDGGIRAMIGGRSYRRSQFNRAVKAMRQPGSAFKPFVYLAAVESGLGPDSMATDAPVSINGWKPRNYSGKHRGEVTLRDGLSKSINSVAVRLTMEVGRWRVVRTARRLGVHSPLHERPSIALGTAEVTLLELVAAYTPFANGGKGVAPHIIRRVRMSSGKTIFEQDKADLGQVIAQPYVAAMNDMLQATLIDGTGRRAALSRWPAAGKTGTTQKFRDAWFVGYTSRLIGGVWVGRDNGRPMKGVTGGSLPAEIWRRVMERAHQGARPAPLPGIKSADLGKRAYAARN